MTMGNPVYLLYDGNRYAISGKAMEDIQREIDEAMADGAPKWLEVNYGEGRPTLARILISPGMQIALQQDNPQSSEA